jgi:hypothetical protein
MQSCASVYGPVLYNYPFSPAVEDGIVQPVRIVVEIGNIVQKGPVGSDDEDEDDEDEDDRILRMGGSSRFRQDGCTGFRQDEDEDGERLEDADGDVAMLVPPMSGTGSGFGVSNAACGFGGRGGSFGLVRAACANPALLSGSDACEAPF